MKRLLPLLALCAALLTTFSCGKPQPEPEPEGPVAVTGITIEPASLSITEGQEANLFVTIAPDNADNKDFSISVSDETVITAVKVGDNRVTVTAVKAGAATVTVKSADGGKTSTCSVEIAAAEIPVESISFGFEEDEIEASQIGHTFRLAVNFSPSNATNLNSLTATSSNPDVIAVTEEGFLVMGPGTAVITLSNADGSVSTSCTFTVLAPGIQWVKMEYEKLPDMTIPRSNMAIFYCGDELVVAGGHTTGFYSKNTAEYYKDGAWQPLDNMYSPHDNAACVPLANGKVAILGGTGNSGVGQYANVDIYDPATHSFFELPSRMTTGRGLFHGAAIGNDIVICGNNGYTDYIERYSETTRSFDKVKDVSTRRTEPYVFQSAANNAIFFGGAGTSDFDRLEGDSFLPELFKSWGLLDIGTSFKSTDCLIGDLSADDYRYLIAIKYTYKQYGLCLIEGDEFSLIETNVEIPYCDERDVTFSNPNAKTIYWCTNLLVDRSKQAGYLIGNDRRNNGSETVYYILKIDYAPALSSGKANLTLYYSDPISDIAAGQSGYALMPDGRVLVAGGIYDSNFNPYQTVYAFQPF